jgi:hypothetical protein
MSLDVDGLGNVHIKTLIYLDDVAHLLFSVKTNRRQPNYLALSPDQ